MAVGSNAVGILTGKHCTDLFADFRVPSSCLAWLLCFVFGLTRTSYLREGSEFYILRCISHKKELGILECFRLGS